MDTLTNNTYYAGILALDSFENLSDDEIESAVLRIICAKYITGNDKLPLLICYYNSDLSCKEHLEKKYSITFVSYAEVSSTNCLVQTILTTNPELVNNLEDFLYVEQIYLGLDYYLNWMKAVAYFCLIKYYASCGYNQICIQDNEYLLHLIVANCFPNCNLSCGKKITKDLAIEFRQTTGASVELFKNFSTDNVRLICSIKVYNKLFEFDCGYINDYQFKCKLKLAQGISVWFKLCKEDASPSKSMVAPVINDAIKLLKSTNNIHCYLDTLKHFSNKYLIAIATRDTPGDLIPDSVLFLLKTMGFENLKRNLWLMYVGVSNCGQMLIDANGVNPTDPVQYKTFINNHVLDIYSSSWKDVKCTTICYDGKNYSLNCRGLNIVIIDVVRNEVISKVGYDSHIDRSLWLYQDL